YTIGKRGKDVEAGSDITVSVLEQIFSYLPFVFILSSQYL
ncbi:unnamed protein product, partial [marine sediment metagenome]